MDDADQSTWERQLSAVMKARAAREFKRFLKEPIEPVLTPKELEERVQWLKDRIKVDEQTSANRQPDVVSWREGARRWLRGTLAHIEKYESMVRQRMGEELPGLAAVRGQPVMNADGPEDEAVRTPKAILLEENAEPRDWILVGISTDDTGGCELEFKTNGEEVGRHPELVLTIGDRNVMPTRKDIYDDGIMELHCDKAAANMVLDGGFRWEVGNGDDGKLIVSLYHVAEKK